MRLVLDTTTAVSGLIWGGVPRRLIDAAELFEGYAALVQPVVPAVIGPAILADPDDEIVLATAAACGADAIVSGDAHLLGIGESQGTPIVTPSEAVSRLAV